MALLNQETLQCALAALQDPHTGKPIQVDCEVLPAEKDPTQEAPAQKLKLTLGYASQSWHPVLAALVKQALRESGQEGAADVDIDIAERIEARSVRGKVKPLANVRNLIVVASGKGGVGKSCVSTNLALALVEEGARVGILDADIYGPSQPRMLGVPTTAEAAAKNKLVPLMSHGIQSMSIGYLIDEQTAMIWRGPMVTQALEQLLHSTQWEDLDYLILDLPPGTGDVQLTIAQRVPVTAAILVTTPQDIALMDVRRAQKMFAKTEIPILGLVENMAGFVCPSCGHTSAIFAEGGGNTLAQEFDIPLLASIPLSLSLRKYSDQGDSLQALEPQSDLAKSFRFLARSVGARLAHMPVESRGLFPDIVISDD